MQLIASTPQLQLYRQAVYQPYLTSAPGTVSQVKECAASLLRIAKKKKIPIFIVGHVTKEGSIAVNSGENSGDTILNFGEFWGHNT